MPEEFQYIIPKRPPPPADIFAVYQATREFYREVEYRQEFESYCQWYRATADNHRKEYQKMQSDINIWGWFNRGKR